MNSKRLLTIILIGFTFVFSSSFSSSSEYDIRQFFSAIQADSGTKALTADGEVNEITHVLVPTKLKEGKYSITVTRKAKDLYRVDGEDIYIETRYSYEYAIREDVILIVESNTGFSKGKLIF